MCLCVRACVCVRVLVCVVGGRRGGSSNTAPRNYVAFGHRSRLLVGYMCADFGIPRCRAPTLQYSFLIPRQLMCVRYLVCFWVCVCPAIVIRFATSSGLTVGLEEDELAEGDASAAAATCTLPVALLVGNFGVLVRQVATIHQNLAAVKISAKRSTLKSLRAQAHLMLNLHSAQDKVLKINSEVAQQVPDANADVVRADVLQNIFDTTHASLANAIADKLKIVLEKVVPKLVTTSKGIVEGEFMRRLGTAASPEDVVTAELSGMLQDDCWTTFHKAWVAYEDSGRQIIMISF